MILQIYMSEIFIIERIFTIAINMNLYYNESARKNSVLNIKVITYKC
jgi:hypothetical protein